MFRSLLLIAATALPVLPPSTLPAVSGWQPVTLRPGVNRVPHFLPGGGTATIVQGWHDNGNAHGWHDWFVLGSPSSGERFGVVPIDGGSSGETIRDDPFDGERVIGTVRFARALVNGKPESLLVKAFLEQDGAFADHDAATIRLFVLPRHDEVGETTESFVPLGAVHTVRRYCNVDLAVRDTIGLPLPADYAGANRRDGCFPDR